MRKLNLYCIVESMEYPPNNESHSYHNWEHFRCNGILIISKVIYISPLLAQQLQHMGKHFPLPLLTPHAICTLSNLHTNAVCVLVYIPSLVGGAFILAAI